MSKRAIDIKTAAGLKIRQRLALALLAGSFEDFSGRRGAEWPRDLARYLDTNHIQIFGKTKSKEELAEFLTWTFENVHELQPRHFQHLAKRMPQFPFLRDFEQVRSVPLRVALSDCFLTTFTAGALSLDWDPRDRRVWFMNEKKRCARLVLEREHKRWAPRTDFSAHLNALPLEFLTRPHVRSLKQSSQYVRQLVQDSLYEDGNFAPRSFKVSPALARRFPKEPGPDLLFSLVQLAFDEEPLHPSIHLRWALSVCACATAVQALNACEPATAGANHRDECDATLGVAKLFLDDSGGDDWALTVRVVNRLSLPQEDERMLRALWGVATLRSATAKLHHTLQALAIDKKWIWDAWSRSTAEQRQETRERLKKGKTPRPESMRLWRGLDWHHRLMSSMRGLQRALNFRNGMFRRRKPFDASASALPNANSLSPRDIALIKNIHAMCLRESLRVVNRAKKQNRSLERRDYEDLVRIYAMGKSSGRDIRA
jgi:hypothetical protein